MVKSLVCGVTPLSAAVLACLLPAVASLTKNSMLKLNQGAAPASVPADYPAPAPVSPCFKKMPLKAQEQGFDGKMVIHEDGQSHTSDWMKEYGANVSRQLPREQELSDAETKTVQKAGKSEESKTKATSETKDKKSKEDTPEDLKSAVPGIPQSITDAVPTVPIPGMKSCGIRAIANLWALVAIAAASFHMSWAAFHSVL